VAGIGVSGEGTEIGHYSGAKRVQMEIADELEQIRVVFHHY
jgi:hypothetical protein